MSDKNKKTTFSVSESFPETFDQKGFEELEFLEIGASNKNLKTPIEKIDGENAHKISDFLASDLAEKYIAANISDAMIEGSREKAANIRKMSEQVEHVNDPRVQEYFRVHRCISFALFYMLQGYGGFNLVKKENE